MTIEQFPGETQPAFDEHLIPLFKAVYNQLARYEGTKKFQTLLAKELRQRALDHGENIDTIGQQFYAWREAEKEHI